MAKKPAIIVLSSHVIRGTVGNRAAAFALEVMGFPVWIVPTVTLPWHPGHGPSHRFVAPSAEFNNLIDDLINAPWLGEVGAVLSGYLGDPTQVSAVRRLVDAVKHKNPDALYALDPVMGDAQGEYEGRLYISEQQALAIKEQLLPFCDMITPNPFELGWLTDSDTPKNQSSLIEAAVKLDRPRVLATSAPAMIVNHIGNMLIETNEGKTKTHLAEHRLVNGPPNGLGDLAAALMLGNILQSQDAVASLRKTSASLYEVMMIAAQAQSDELMLEASIGSLIKPRTSIDARLIVQPRKKQ